MDISQVITREEFESGRKFMNLTYDQLCGYIMKIVKLAVEESLRTLPSVVGHVSKQATYVETLSKAFYDSNKDLAKHKPMVAQMIEQEESNNPGMGYSKILEIVAPAAKLRMKELDNIAKVKGSRKLKDLDENLGNL